jgi:uncharacterized protein
VACLACTRLRVPPCIHCRAAQVPCAACPCHKCQHQLGSLESPRQCCSKQPTSAPLPHQQYDTNATSTHSTALSVCLLLNLCIITCRYLPHAFIVNDAQVEGPILCLSDSWLLWDVQTFSDAINPQNLAILDLLDPPPEVLVVGCGATMRPLPQQLQEFLRARNIAAEMLDTVSTKHGTCLQRSAKTCLYSHTHRVHAVQMQELALPV